MVLLYGVKSCEELQAESKAQELQAEIEELQAVINASKAPEQNATLMDTIDEEGFPSILNREQKPQRILVQFSLSTKPKWLARKEVFATVTQSLWNTMQNKWTRTRKTEVSLSVSLSLSSFFISLLSLSLSYSQYHRLEKQREN